MAVYRQYLKDQVRELLTNYGKIDIIWLDYSFPAGTHGKGRADWDSVGLLKMVRELQPRHHRQRPARPARRARRMGLPDARAVQAGASG